MTFGGDINIQCIKWSSCSRWHRPGECLARCSTVIPRSRAVCTGTRAMLSPGDNIPPPPHESTARLPLSQHKGRGSNFNGVTASLKSSAFNSAITPHVLVPSTITPEKLTADSQNKKKAPLRKRF